MKMTINLTTGGVITLPLSAAERAQEAIDAARGRAKSMKYIDAMTLRVARSAALAELADEKIEARRP